MVAGPRRELDIAELPEFPAHGRFIKRDCKFRMKPLCQVAGPPSHHAMDRRRRPALHDRRKRLTLIIIEFGLPAGRLAIDQPVRTAGIESHDLVAHDLQTYTADPCRIASKAATPDLGQRQQPAALVRVLGFPGQAPQCRAVKIRP